MHRIVDLEANHIQLSSTDAGLPTGHPASGSWGSHEGLLKITENIPLFQGCIVAALVLECGIEPSISQFQNSKISEIWFKELQYTRELLDQEAIKQN